jgi:hypothetical protein
MILKEKGQTMMKNSRANLHSGGSAQRDIFSLFLKFNFFSHNIRCSFFRQKKLKRNHQSKSRTADEFSIQKTTKCAQRKKRKCG